MDPQVAHEAHGSYMLSKYEKDWERVRAFNDNNVHEAAEAEKRLGLLERRASYAMLSWRELEAHSKAWLDIQTSLNSLTREVSSICKRVGTLDIVLEQLQRSREVCVVEAWDQQKNRILKDYKIRSKARVDAILQERKEQNLKLWQTHFEEAFRKYQEGGPAPQGFLYEVALLQNGKATGKWLPCRLDFKHPDGSFDVTVAGGSTAPKVATRWIRRGRNFQNNRREMMENSLSAFKPKGLASKDLDRFYEDISDDDDPEEDMKCPNLHQLTQADKADFVCDVCLRNFQDEMAFSCRPCDFDVCNPCYSEFNKNIKSARAGDRKAFEGEAGAEKEAAADPKDGAEQATEVETTRLEQDTADRQDGEETKTDEAKAEEAKDKKIAKQQKKKKKKKKLMNQIKGEQAMQLEKAEQVAVNEDTEKDLKESEEDDQTKKENPDDTAQPHAEKDQGEEKNEKTRPKIKAGYNDDDLIPKGVSIKESLGALSPPEEKKQRKKKKKKDKKKKVEKSEEPETERQQEKDAEVKERRKIVHKKRDSEAEGITVDMIDDALNLLDMDMGEDEDASDD